MATTQDDQLNQSAFAQQIVESHFPSQQTFVSFEEDSEQPKDESFFVNSLFAESPFPSVFEMENETENVDPETEEMVAFLSELNDEEFDEAVCEIINEADGLLQNRFGNEFVDPMTKIIAGKRLLAAHVEPLVREAEMFLEGLAQELERRNIEVMTEAEFDELIDRYEPSNPPLAPAFEQFFKKLKKKLKQAAKASFSAVKRGVKNVVKRGIKAAGTIGRYALKGLNALSGAALLQAVLKKLKRLVKPLLKIVLDKAINRLPVLHQPIARTLRDKLLRSGALTHI